jgi:hypothetical protein
MKIDPPVSGPASRQSCELAITSGTADGFSIRGAARRHFTRVQM